MLKSSVVEKKEIDAELHLYFTWVFVIMGMGLVITALTAYAVQSNEALFSSLTYVTESMNEDGEMERGFGASGLWWGIAILELGLVIVLATFGFSKRVSGFTALSLFGIYAALNGFTLAPILYMYTSTSVTKVFLISGGTFGLSALWGHTTKRNLLSLQGFFMQALIGLLLVLVINMFFSSPLIDMLVSGAAVLLFIGLTAFDMQKLRALYNERGWSPGLAVYGALTLYLDFINLLLHLLRLFGVKKD